SPMQQGMLFHTLLAPKSGVYFEQILYTLTGNLQEAAFRLAWQQAVDRHQLLRTLFVWEGQKKPLQVVRRRVALPWEQLDWRGLSGDEQTVKLAAFLQTDRQRGFDLGQAPLMRLALIRMDETHCELIWSHHHLLMDGWSSFLILKDVMAIYRALKEGRDYRLGPLRPYREFVDWLQTYDQSKAESYWRTALKGFTVPTPLLGSNGEAGHASDVYVAAQEVFHFSSSLMDAMKLFAKRHDLTLSTLVHAAWAMMLSRYSGEHDIVFGSTGSGRSAELEGIDSMVGLFLNTLPVRAQFSPQDSVLAWLRDFQSHLAELRQYEHSSLVDIKAWSEVDREHSLFESIMVFENYAVDTSVWGQDGTLQISNVRVLGPTNYPLTAIFVPGKDLYVRLSYDSRRFDAPAISRMFGHLNALLEGILSNPDHRLLDLPMLTEGERHQLLVEWNRTQRDFPRNKCIHEVFEEQVERTPDAVAAVFEGDSLSYRELNSRANRLSHHLRALGVGPNVLVGLSVERSFEMIIGLLGILKAGGAYWALEENLPEERLQLMLADASPKVLLFRRKSGKPPPDLSGKSAADLPAVASIEDLMESSPVETTTATSPAQASDPAYVSYTSGSTGRPKGVVVPHRAVVRLVKGTDYASLSAKETLLHLSPLSFDASTFELWGALLNGGRVVVMAPRPPTLAEIGEAIRLHGVTSAWLTAGLFHLMVDERLDDLKPLRQLLTGGDVLSPEHVRKARRALPGCRIINGYGPTENTTFTCCYTVVDERELSPSVPIGRPIANTQVYILDEARQPVPEGVAGELYAGGDGLACGYLHQPQLTDQRFVPDPFSGHPGARLYRTGDRARWRSEGNIEYLGRLDHQVKIRGFRVELGEIEEALNQHPGVQTSLALAREDRSGDKCLTAYVVSRNGAASPLELREFLQLKLPDYMVPAHFVFLEKLPLTPNGKVDRKALPKPDFEPVADDVVPRTPTEIVLARIWCEVLGLKHVGIHDNFFELGGHSLLAVQLISKISKSLILKLPIPVLFQNPTIEKLAAVVDQENHDKREPKLINNESATPLVTFQAKGNRPPLFFLHGDWAADGLYCGRFSQQLGEEQPFYALPPYRSGKRAVLTMEEMAKYHIAAIQEHTPHGPYLMGGYCAGATVVVEIARQLVEQGEKVTHLFVIAPNLGGSRLLRGIWPVVDKLGEILKWDLQKTIYYFQHYGAGFDHWFGKSPRGKFITLCHRLGFANRIGSRPITEENDGDLQYNFDYAIYHLACQLSNLKPLSVPTTLYFPEEAPRSRRRANFVREIFPIATVEMVPGNHHTCIVKHSSALVDKMKRTLDGLFSRAVGANNEPASSEMSGESVAAETVRAVVE
ncbi:MAG: amino acid adenylation domain-containing protein, partial [Verrucomicrobia bacterium]|nr:amino acid adenylation domain-containing protein [Verrucomicrobiota bacterium]